MRQVPLHCTLLGRVIRGQIRKDIQKAIDNSQLTIDKSEVLVTRTVNPKFGDFTTNIALKITKNQRAKESKIEKAQIKQSPMEFAKVLADSLQNLAYIKKLEVVMPGFINFFVKDEVWQKEISEALKEGPKFGSNNRGRGKKARVEFVSANPTGPLHFGNARGGPIGDSLASVLAFCGYKVVREYLHNDVGEQVGKLGVSILNVVAGKPLEEQEYKGEYIREFADKITAQIRKKTRPTGITSPSLDLDKLGKEAVEKLLSEILADCEALGIKFDEVYPESDFIKNGQTKKVLDELEKKHFLREKDGALWFAPQLRQGFDGRASDEFLKDRETVVKKSDGAYTYFANDIAYHNLKFAENPALVIDVLGANHHGHVPRLQAVIKALGYDVSKFHVILYQLVRFRRHGELAKMSKRSGTFVTAKEVLDEIGKDALRFFTLMHDANSPIDFDLDLAREKSPKNPVYYVQYAHARICSILTKAKRLTTNAEDKLSTVNCELLTSSYELDLIKQITRLPELVEDIAKNFAVHRLTAYAVDLADSFHKFYENCPVLSEKEDLKQTRLGLILATKTALLNTLNLLGISAPQKM